MPNIHAVIMSCGDGYYDRISRGYDYEIIFINKQGKIIYTYKTERYMKGLFSNCYSIFIGTKYGVTCINTINFQVMWEFKLNYTYSMV